MTALEHYTTPESLPSSEAVRIGTILGLPAAQPMSYIDLAERISEGLRPSSVDAVGSIIGKQDVVGSCISEASLRRARKQGKRLSRELSERLYEVSRVIDAVSRCYQGDREAIERFLRKPHNLLAGKTPLAMAQSNSAGAQAVINLLKRAQSRFAL